MLPHSRMLKSTIFLTLAVAGCGRTWTRSTPHESLRLFRGKDILRRDDTYFKAATTPSHPNSFLEVSPTELVLGVSGLGYPAFHEEGAENLSARPVYELIAAGAAFEERISQLGEKWQREEIAILERSF